MKAQNKVRRISNCLLVLIVMGIIYKFSSQPSKVSYNLSKKFSIFFNKGIKIMPFIPDGLKSLWLASPIFYVRKLAHLLVYTLLGAVTMTALSRFKVKSGKQISAALLICIFYAMLDEWHQYFVDGRTASLKDVCIDTLGALTGIATILLIKYVLKLVIKYQNTQKNLKS